MPKQTVTKKPAAPKRATKPKAKTTAKPKPKPKTTTKPRAKTTTKPKPKATTKPRARTTTKPKPKTKPAPKPVVVVDIEAEFPYDEFPWKLVYKDRTEKRTCYFQCEEHRKKHVTRYKLSKKEILFIGYKYD